MNVIKECIAFICPMLEMGGGKKNTPMTFWSSLSTCGIHFAKTSPFPQAVGEDTANTWRDFDFCGNCCA